MGGGITRVWMLVLLLFVCAGGTAAAQTELGTITGTVKDAQGAVLPGVTATAVNRDTNVTTVAVTNGQGVYLLSSLVAGTYKVTFTLASFAPIAREIDVRSGDRLRVDLALRDRRDDRGGARRRGDAAAPDVDARRAAT